VRALPAYNEDGTSMIHPISLGAHRLQNKKIIEHALFGREGGEWRGARPPRLLDVGCGNGQLLEVAKSIGVESVGITLIPEEVREASARLTCTN